MLLRSPSSTPNARAVRLAKLLAYLKENGIVVATAESCTAGLIAGRLADAAGAGSALDVGYVVYSEEGKKRCLGVSARTIERFGLTSEEVSIEMARGALRRSSATIAIADTGVAGEPPEGSDVPAGTLCFAWAVRTAGRPRVFSETLRFEGSRNAVRRAAADHALERIPYFWELAGAPTRARRRG